MIEFAEISSKRIVRRGYHNSLVRGSAIAILVCIALISACGSPSATSTYKETSTREITVGTDSPPASFVPATGNVGRCQKESNDPGLCMDAAAYVEVLRAKGYTTYLDPISADSSSDNWHMEFARGFCDSNKEGAAALGFSNYASQTIPIDTNYQVMAAATDQYGRLTLPNTKISNFDEIPKCDVGIPIGYSIMFIGFDDLQTRGMFATDIEKVKHEITNYSTTQFAANQGALINIVNLTIDDHTGAGTGEFTYVCTLIIDGKRHRLDINVSDVLGDVILMDTDGSNPVILPR